MTTDFDASTRSASPSGRKDASEITAPDFKALITDDRPIHTKRTFGPHRRGSGTSGAFS